jgi:hypothetical protein
MAKAVLHYDGESWSASDRWARTPGYLCHTSAVIDRISNAVSGVSRCFVPNDDEVWMLGCVRRASKRPDHLLEWCRGAAPDWHPEFQSTFMETEYDRTANAILARKRLWEIPTARGHWNANWDYVGFHGCSLAPRSFGTNRNLLGRYNSPTTERSGKRHSRNGSIDSGLRQEINLKWAKCRFPHSEPPAPLENRTIARKYHSLRQQGLCARRWRTFSAPWRPQRASICGVLAKYQAISGGI